MRNAGRPMSPHLSIYRWPITMTLSILHRLTGVLLSLGLLLLAAWLVVTADGAAAYQSLTNVLQSVLGRILLAAWSFAFFYHFANGIRHLAWDLGYGFEKSQANASSWVVVVATLVLTILYWLVL
jgi:succinate dehydrogenase / fumarate reductase, cytochrome b subunit